MTEDYTKVAAFFELNESVGAFRQRLAEMELVGFSLAAVPRQFYMVPGTDPASLQVQVSVEDGDEVVARLTTVTDSSRADGAEEITLKVGEMDEISAFLKRLALVEGLCVRTVRERWGGKQPGQAWLSVNIETWPGLPPFVEIVGRHKTVEERLEVVRQAADMLGFDYGEAVFGTMVGMYERKRFIPTFELLALKTLPYPEVEVPDYVPFLADGHPV